MIVSFSKFTRSTWIWKWKDEKISNWLSKKSTHWIGQESNLKENEMNAQQIYQD
jgi:hypothetical protein